MQQQVRQARQAPMTPRQVRRAWAREPRSRSRCSRRLRPRSPRFRERRGHRRSPRQRSRFPRTRAQPAGGDARSGMRRTTHSRWEGRTYGSAARWGGRIRDRASPEHDARNTGDTDTKTGAKRLARVGRRRRLSRPPREARGAMHPPKHAGVHPSFDADCGSSIRQAPVLLWDRSSFADGPGSWYVTMVKAKRTQQAEPSPPSIGRWIVEAVGDRPLSGREGSEWLDA